MSGRVRRLRRDRDWTQAGLAKRIGIARQSLNIIERGGTPSLVTALALGRVLETPVADLFPELDRDAATIIDTISRSKP